MDRPSTTIRQKHKLLALWALLASASAAAILGYRYVSAQRPVTVSGGMELMSTRITITLVAPSKEEGNAHLKAAFERLAQLEKILSAHREGSDLAEINASAGKDPVAVSEDLFNAITHGVEWYDRTNGAFDITLAPLLEVWAKASREQTLPSAKNLALARSLLGVKRIELDKMRRTVRLPVAGMRLGLGGLGKGFCADAVAQLLRQRGVKGAIVALAGDIHVIGTRANGAPWRIGIQDPGRPDDPEACLKVLMLADICVSTSGNYRRFVEIEGRHYSHIVDPRTGLTAENVPSVTVIAPETLATDILGTALSVEGLEDGMKLLSSLPDAQAMFITYDEENEPHFTSTPGFDKFVVGDSPADE